MQILFGYFCVNTVFLLAITFPALAQELAEDDGAPAASEMTTLIDAISIVDHRPPSNPHRVDLKLFDASGSSLKTDTGLALSAGALVLHEIDSRDFGRVLIVDENPNGPEPAIAIMMLSNSARNHPLPLVHEDGSSITAFEYISVLDSEATQSVDHRILWAHKKERGDENARVFALFGASSLSSGSCEASAWENYFRTQHTEYGISGILDSGSEHVIDATTLGAFESSEAYGTFGTFGQIVAGVCFVEASADGKEEIKVAMEQRVDGEWERITGWSHLETPVSVTDPDGVEDPDAQNRFIYKSTVACNTRERRIVVSGRPPGGIYAPDRFHLSGAWKQPPCALSFLAP